MLADILLQLMPALVAPAVESSIAVQKADKNRGLYRTLLRACLRGALDTIAPQSLVELHRWLRTRRLRTPTRVWMRDRAR